MTKSTESGENEISLDAKKEALRTGIHVCDVLANWLIKAKKAQDRHRVRKIAKAQK